MATANPIYFLDLPDAGTLDNTEVLPVIQGGEFRRSTVAEVNGPALTVAEDAKLIAEGAAAAIPDLSAPTFTQAAARANLVSGETLPTLFGKLSKWYADFSNTAFKDYTTVFTMASMPITYSHILVQATAATAWSVASSPPLGSHFQIMLYNYGSSAFTQAIPNTGSWDPSNQTTVVVQPSKFVELSLWIMFNRFIVIVREP